MELHPKDRTILELLDKNSRISLNELARKLRLSKDGVGYRLRKLEEEGIITRYFIDIDVSKFGLLLGKISYKFQNTTKEKEEEIFTFFKKHRQIGWAVFCSGSWDAIIVVYVKDMHEYSDVVKDINEKYGRYIYAKEFVAHQSYYVCSRKWFGDARNFTVSYIGGSRTPEKIDEKDRMIIKLLAENARIPIIDIARRTRLTSGAIIKRIRALEQKKVILNYRIGLNLEKLGKEFCKSFVYLQNASSEKEQEIVKRCLQHPNVTAVTHAIGPWDIELEMEVKNFDEFYRIMNELKNAFKDTIKNYEAVVITKEYGIDYSRII